MKRPAWLLPGATALLVASISYLKSWHCRSNFFQSPDSYTHLCYSDIPALFGARGLDQGINPYADPLNSMEYPVGTGYIASFLARFSKDFLHFFDINAAALAILFITLSILLSRQSPIHWPLFTLAPAVVASLYINWDLWGVIVMILSFILIRRERFDLAGLFFGLSIAIKFFPIFILPAFTIYFLMRGFRRDRGALHFFGYALLTWIATNLSTALTHFEGWSRFYTFNQDRGIDLGSLWYAIDLFFGITFSHLNLLVALIALVFLAFFWRPIKSAIVAKEDPYQTLLLLSFLSLAFLFSFNKVYSPQYILWLTPIAILLISTSRERALFWVWQSGEGLYHLAIWQYLAQYSGGEGLSEPLYALSILIRMATLCVFALSLARARLFLPSSGPAHAGSSGRFLEREKRLNPPVAESP